MTESIILYGITKAEFFEQIREIVKEENSRLVNPEQPDDLLSHGQIAHIYNISRETISRKIKLACIEQVVEGKKKYIRRWQAEKVFRVGFDD